MRLPGRLRWTTLGDVLGALYRERATGALELVEDHGMTAGRSHRVYLEAGLVAALDTPLKSARLGEILKQQGFIGDDACRRLVQRLQEMPGMRTGELLIDEAFVTPAVISAALRHQVRLQLDALFAIPDALLRFHAPRPRGMHAGKLPLSPREFLHGRKRARVAAPHKGAAMRHDPVQRRALLVLGLNPLADRTTVQRAFRKLAAAYHPDRHPLATPEQRAALIQRFAELSAAYHALVA